MMVHDKSCQACGQNIDDSLELSKPLELAISPLVQTLIVKNDPPLLSEEQVIRNIVNESEHTLSILDERICHLESALVQFRHRRDEVQKYTEEHKSVFSPFRRLPYEIIAEIILHATGNYSSTQTKLDGWNGVVTLDGKRGPWVYGRVCHSWNSVVHSLPALWSNIYVSSLHYLRPSSAEVMKTILTRSREHPLLLSVSLSPRQMKYGKGFMEIIAAQSHRWQHFKCIVNEELASALVEVKGKLPLLQSLILKSTSRDASKTLQDCFKDASRLRRASLKGELRLELPYSHITHFETNDDDPSNILAILGQMTNVTDCILKESLSGYLSVEVSTTKVSCLSLKSLTVDCFSVMDRLTLPALENIAIPSTPHFLTSLSALLARSSCSLSSLALEGVSQEHDIIPLLTNLPTLTELHLPNIRRTVPSFIAKLVYAPPSGLLPCLEHVFLEFALSSETAKSTLNLKMIADIISSRWSFSKEEMGIHAPSKLKSFHGHFLTGMDPWNVRTQGSLKAFAAFRAQGLDVVVNFSRPCMY